MDDSEFIYQLIAEWDYDNAKALAERLCVDFDAVVNNYMADQREVEQANRDLERSQGWNV